MLDTQGGLRAKVRAAALILLCAVATTVVVGSSPAHADPTLCETGEFCVWTGPNQTGTFGQFAFGDNDLRGSVFNNNIESVRNRTGVVWCLYDAINYSHGARYTSIGATYSGSLNSFVNITSSLRRSPNGVSTGC